MNELIISMLYNENATPDNLKFIMIDPKAVELHPYNDIPHILAPVITDVKKSAAALNWLVYEMDRRYMLLKDNGVRNIDEFNLGSPQDEKLPRIIVIIDEMADLMMVMRKEVETAIARIAQKARACGVHLILATQRPEAKIVTGIIKANIPSRIAFAVKSSIDSRIILDTGGAEKLVGRGDMLYLPMGASVPLRVQDCFVSSEEVNRVIKHIYTHSGKPNYNAELMACMERDTEPDSFSDRIPYSGDMPAASTSADPMLASAIEVIIESGQGSTSYLQRRLKLGYARAARLMDEMEERGIVGPFEGSKPRAVLITMEEWEELKKK
jgi:S-DNA-T family DNA segregation ATPase FtsK/SpoIIIE